MQRLQRPRVRKRRKIHARFRKERTDTFGLVTITDGYAYILAIWEEGYKTGWTHFLNVLKEVDFPLYETLVERYGRTFKAVQVCSEFFNKDFKRMFETKNWVHYGQ